jgi:two-component system, chemotaxis family, sensor kinase CheA
MDEQAEVTKEFLLESYDGLNQLEQGLMNYEKNPGDKETLTSIFRVLHTIKGTSGFLGFEKLPQLAHAGENILTLLRSGKMTLNSDLASMLLSLVDALRKILNHIEKTEKEGEGDIKPLVDKINRVAAQAAEIVAKPEVATAAPEAESRSHQLEDTSIRVEVNLLDRLMNLTGELVLARNQALQFAASQNNPIWNNMLQPLNDLTLKIQEDVMKARLQPVLNLWSRFPRVVRDMAQACGKKVRLEMEGADTEIDKGILEAIRDPLTHLIRNCVDHGIEKPETRSAAKKNPEGTVFLRAFHEAGLVQIEIADDGAGISLEKVKAKALKEGLITPQQAADMNPETALHLIFRPGFSTAQEVTQFSGRGVGMDVVKTNIERIGGKVEVKTKAGQGTTFLIKIPLTLAIIPALITYCAGQRFVVPRVNLLELIQLKEKKIQKNIEYLHQVPVYRLRGKLLPLVFLKKELKLGDEKDTGSSLYIAVLRVDDRLFGLVVDDVSDFQEVVVKPLGKHLKDIPLYAGTTILGDGKVALILDILGLAQRAHVVSEIQESFATAATEEGAAQVPTVSQMLLIFKTPDDGRMAMTMQEVVRLEVFYKRWMEKTGALDVIQYEGRILPLIFVSQVLPERRQLTRVAAAAAEKIVDEQIQVVVCKNEDEQVGLVVDKILDIVETPQMEVLRPASRAGVRGSIIVRDRVTELVDLPGLVSLGDPSLGRKFAVKDGSHGK